MASHSPENILRRLIITEMEGIAQYKDLMVYLNSEERKVINEIIKDEQIHTIQLTEMLKKHIDNFGELEKKAKEEITNRD